MHTLAQLEEEFGVEAVADLMTQLRELVLVEDAADRAGRASLVERQLRTPATSEPGLAPSECQRRLRGEGRVAQGGGLVGCCLGSRFLRVGEMELVDGNRIEGSNPLNRQLLFNEAENGQG